MVHLPLYGLGHKIRLSVVGRRADIWTVTVPFWAGVLLGGQFGPVTCGLVDAAVHAWRATYQGVWSQASKPTMWERVKETKSAQNETCYYGSIIALSIYPCGPPPIGESL
jgi:hypothetical protein